MALRIDIKEETLMDALKLKQASLKRSISSGINMNAMMKEILQKDLKELEKSMTTISDAK